MRKNSGGIIETELGGAHLEAFELIGRNKKVLDVGCSTGNLAKIICEELGCIVDGVEINPETAKLAAQVVRRIYTGSIEDISIQEQIFASHEIYDILLFMDVLEHLKDPLSVLINTKRLLADDGYIVASVPNIANWRIRFSLLFGKFEYQESGLLDKGHLRFFTLKTLRNLFSEAGYEIVYLNFTLGTPPIISEGIIKPTKNILKVVFKNLFRPFPGLFANQFIIKAVKKK